MPFGGELPLVSDMTSAMNIERSLTWHSRSRAAPAIWLFAGALMMMSAIAVAQERAPAPAEEPGFFGRITNWFDSTFKDAGQKVESFGSEAGIAARSTVDGAKDAAGAIARVPGTRVITGHQKCDNAPNGAPDCRSAANSVCKAKGFESGKSLDMTTAEVCPPKALLSGGDKSSCRDETFVSRVLCQ
jgi:hypothetical protein